MAHKLCILYDEYALYSWKGEPIHMTRVCRILLCAAVVEFVLAVILFLYPKTHIQVGDRHLLFKDGMQVTIHPLLGRELVLDDSFLQACGQPNIWFAFRKTAWAPGFPDSFVYLEPNTEQWSLEDVLRRYQNDDAWTFVDDDEDEDENQQILKVLEMVIDASGTKTYTNDIVQEDTPEESAAPLSFSGFFNHYRYIDRYKSTVIFTARRTTGDPDTFFRFYFKISRGHILRMETKWTGKPKVPKLLDKAFYSVEVN